MKQRDKAIGLVRTLIYSLVNLKLHHNAKFSTTDFLDVLTHTAYTHDFTENGSKTFDIQTDKDTPSGDLLLHHFSKFGFDELLLMFQKINENILTYIKKNFNILNRAIDIAVDIHDIPFYGEDLFYACGGKNSRGTTKFFKFLTISSLVRGQRFILYVIPLTPFSKVDSLIDDGLNHIKRFIKIKIIYLDRGFNSSAVINTLYKHKVKFVMPMVRNLKVKNAFEKSEGINSRIFKDYLIGETKVNLVLVDDHEKIKRAFITNIELSPAIAHYLYKMYSKRWGIETGYRNLAHDFRPKTTTRNYNIRLFYFLFSTHLYNLWVLANIVVSVALHGRILDKPIITAKIFVVLLCNWG